MDMLDWSCFKIKLWLWPIAHQSVRIKLQTEDYQRPICNRYDVNGSPQNIWTIVIKCHLWIFLWIIISSPLTRSFTATVWSVKFFSKAPLFPPPATKWSKQLFRLSCASCRLMTSCQDAHLWPSALEPVPTRCVCSCSCRKTWRGCRRTRSLSWHPTALTLPPHDSSSRSLPIHRPVPHPPPNAARTDPELPSARPKVSLLWSAHRPCFVHALLTRLLFHLLSVQHQSVQTDPSQTLWAQQLLPPPQRSDPVRTINRTMITTVPQCGCFLLLQADVKQHLSKQPGAVIESFVRRSPGVFSGTFSGKWLENNAVI